MSPPRLTSAPQPSSATAAAHRSAAYALAVAPRSSRTPSGTVSSSPFRSPRRTWRQSGARCMLTCGCAPASGCRPDPGRNPARTAKHRSSDRRRRRYCAAAASATRTRSASRGLTRTGCPRALRTSRTSESGRNRLAARSISAIRRSHPNLRVGERVRIGDDQPYRCAPDRPLGGCGRRRRHEPMVTTSGSPPSSGPGVTVRRRLGRRCLARRLPGRLVGGGDRRRRLRRGAGGRRGSDRDRACHARDGEAGGDRGGPADALLPRRHALSSSVSGPCGSQPVGRSSLVNDAGPALAC